MLSLLSKTPNEIRKQDWTGYFKIVDSVNSAIIPTVEMYMKKGP
jgi:hypothetical protein